MSPFPVSRANLFGVSLENPYFWFSQTQSTPSATWATPVRPATSRATSRVRWWVGPRCSDHLQTRKFIGSFSLSTEPGTTTFIYSILWCLPVHSSRRTSSLSNRWQLPVVTQLPGHQFSMMHFLIQIYPDAAHSMSSVRPHLYLSMESFLDSCFLEVAGEDERRRKIKASRRWAKGETVVTTGLWDPERKAGAAVWVPTPSSCKGCSARAWTWGGSYCCRCSSSDGGTSLREIDPGDTGDIIKFLECQLAYFNETSSNRKLPSSRRGGAIRPTWRSVGGRLQRALYCIARVIGRIFILYSTYFKTSLMSSFRTAASNSPYTHCYFLVHKKNTIVCT